MTKRRYKFNPKQFRTFMMRLTIFVILYTCFIYLCMFPEMYSTTCKRSLERGINREDQAAIEHYNSTYAANGIDLFGD